MAVSSYWDRSPSFCGSCRAVAVSPNARLMFGSGLARAQLRPPDMLPQRSWVGCFQASATRCGYEAGGDGCTVTATVMPWSFGSSVMLNWSGPV